MKSAFQEYTQLMGMIDSAYHEATLKLHLTDSAMDILYVLTVHGQGCPQSALYKESGMSKSTVNSAIRKMEKEQLLYLTPGFGRNTCVFLTEKGQKLQEETIYRIMQIENTIYDSWTKEEQETFMRLSRDFARKLSDGVKQL